MTFYRLPPHKGGLLPPSRIMTNYGALNFWEIKEILDASLELYVLAMNKKTGKVVYLRARFFINNYKDFKVIEISRGSPFVVKHKFLTGTKIISRDNTSSMRGNIQRGQSLTFGVTDNNFSMPNMKARKMSADLDQRVQIIVNGFDGSAERHEFMKDFLDEYQISMVDAANVLGFISKVGIVEGDTIKFKYSVNEVKELFTTLKLPLNDRSKFPIIQDCKLVEFLKELFDWHDVFEDKHGYRFRKIPTMAFRFNKTEALSFIKGCASKFSNCTDKKIIMWAHHELRLDQVFHVAQHAGCYAKKEADCVIVYSDITLDNYSTMVMKNHVKEKKIAKSIVFHIMLEKYQDESGIFDHFLIVGGGAKSSYSRNLIAKSLTLN
ncbi:uncharacterized protein KGF55_001260 [Candida pseudojiufengensis]|uniref:uncharacterized protein n=1 Tax=Candida pseudojiufengensis TaxID=497109 RepID=UPI0022247ED0|nr:uncharacterized protein KGF55_001260 [Candida pseudojiufengensis]KAI5965896.1 hypothetical protein KGF55_001260 [Candida pseudojiufengensis]